MTLLKDRSLLIACALTTALVVVATNASAATPPRHRAPIHRTRPAITGQPVAGKTLLAWPGHWRGARVLRYRWERCDATGAHCKVIHTGHTRRPVSGRRYRLSQTDVGHRIRVIVHATNAFGATSATSRVTAVIKKRGTTQGPGPGPTPPPPNPGPPSPGPPVNLFALVPSSGNGTPPAGIPRSDAVCAAAVTPTPEKRPTNATANQSVPSDPTAIQWNPAYKTWPAFVSDRSRVTGNFKGTTDEIIQWAACKWGLDVNAARADAWLESGWYMSTRSGCAGPEASVGLFQVVPEDCNGNMVHGGWPYVQNDTATNADYWGAWVRGCFDGAFLTPGYPWQNSPAQGYDGQKMASVVAAHGENYAFWGCIGAWFSNGWYTSPAQGYIATVQKDDAAKPWLQPGT